MTSRRTGFAMLDTHVRDAPLYRAGILAAVQAFEARLADGASVLDAGSGSSPYRCLFPRAAYTTCDWPESPHADAHGVDVVADLRDLPFADASFDAVLLTEVLEHLFEPGAVLTELGRVLRPGGRLLVTIPFVIGVHEAPYDYARYSNFGLEHLLRSAGLHVEHVTPNGGAFSALAASLQVALVAAADRPGTRGRARRRAERAASRACFGVARRLAPLMDRADVGSTFPVGWVAEARRPV